MKRLATKALLVLLLGIASPAATAEVEEKITYYTLRGLTLDELDGEMRRLGPLDAHTGKREPASTQVTFDGGVTYSAGAGICRVATFDMKLSIEFIQPQWRPRSRPPGVPNVDTIRVYNSLEDDIHRVQGEQARIANSWVQKMEGALLGLRPESDCRKMEARVDQVSAGHLQGHADVQRKFMRRQALGLEERMRRALRDN